MVSSTSAIGARIKYFVNLTNGIEAIPALLTEKGVAVDQISFIRIQSSHCEAADHTAILQNLDYNFLMNLALGNICVLYDFGSRGTGMPDDDVRDGVPRAIWWGTEFIKHALEYTWDLPCKSTRRIVKGYNMASDFGKHMKNAFTPGLNVKFCAQISDFECYQKR